MRVIYTPAENWDQFYQTGHGIPGFEGLAFQRGGGLGNFLGRLFRFVLPVAKKAAKAVGKQALVTGADIASDVLKGRNVKKSVKKRGKAAGAKMVAGVKNYIQKGRGLGKRKAIKAARHAKKRRQTLYDEVQIESL